MLFSIIMLVRKSLSIIFNHYACNGSKKKLKLETAIKPCQDSLSKLLYSTSVSVEKSIYLSEEKLTSLTHPQFLQKIKIAKKCFNYSFKHIKIIYYLYENSIDPQKNKKLRIYQRNRFFL